MNKKPDITLVFPSSPFLLNQIMFPPLGIMYLSAFLKQHGMEVQCLDMALGHDPIMAESDIIGLSFTTPQRDEAFKLAKYYKKRGKYVIAGGPHPTHMPDECKDNGIDCVIPGYGEVDLFNKICEVQGVCAGILVDIDIDDYPFPDRECLPIRDYYQEIEGRPATPLIASRGCYGKCSFCSKVSPKFSIQSADRTLREIEYLNEEYGYTAFSIYDDTIATDKKRLSLLAEGLGDKDYKFRCFCRADLLNDIAVCEDLAKMGVVDVGIGIESGSDYILKKNMKGNTVDINTTSIKNLRDVGVGSKAFLIIGLPGENEETVKDTENWINMAKPDDIALSVFQPLPGSDIFNNPERYDIDFKYNGNPMWYRGTPGEYKPSTRTKALSTERIIELRDQLEGCYKRKELLQ